MELEENNLYNFLKKKPEKLGIFSDPFDIFTPTTLYESYINFYKLNNMKQATFTVSLEKAREWFHSNDRELYLIAINLFTEEELTTITYKEIKQENINHLYYSDFVDVLKERVEVIETLCSYFNKGKRVKLNEVGFIIKVNRNKGNMFIVEEICGYNPTVSYFRNREDCKKAIKIIENEHSHLFL